MRREHCTVFFSFMRQLRGDAEWQPGIQPRALAAVPVLNADDVPPGLR